MKYRAIFVDLRDLNHTNIGLPVDLSAANRDEAIEEAARLWGPEGANFIEIVHNGRGVAWLPVREDRRK